MRVAIDMDKMQLLHVHRVQELLHGLVQLESANVRSVRFDSTESPLFLSKLTTLELTLLLRNMTGQQFPPTYDDLARREAIAAAIEAIRPRLVDERELEQQITAVEQQLQGPVGQVPQFRYVLGARVPKLEDGGIAALVTTPLADSTFDSAAKRAPQRRAVPAAATIPPTPSSPAQPALRGARPAGSVRPVVWGVADRMWEAAGKPMDKATVLDLRKKMMDVLGDEHGIKRTSSSTALGEWMKERLG